MQTRARAALTRSSAMLAPALALVLHGCAVTVGTSNGPGKTPDLPTYTVAFTHTRPVIDGKVTEAAWNDAEAITDFHCFGPRTGPPTLGTSAKSATREALQRQVQALRGESGGVLRMVACKSGETLSELRLDAPPVWNGLAVASERLYMAGTDGILRCYGGAN